MNTEPPLPPFRPILSGERPLPPPEPEPPSWFVRHKALTFVLALALVVGATAVANQATGESGQPVNAEQAVQSAADAPKAEPDPEPEPTFREPEKHRGTGDDVVTTDWPAEPGIVTFKCVKCSSNTVVETDGAESLLVNTIGPYRGTRWINIGDGSMTTTFTIKATGAWALTIADLDAVKRIAGKAKGTGDDVVYLDTESTKAKIGNRGESNFVVHVLSSDYVELAVNEIGSYQGTVPLSGPALVEVQSEGKWTIDPS